MENVILGKVENDGKTCSWPTPEREAQTIKILKDMSSPIDKDLLEKIKKSDLVNCKSDALYQWGLENSLTLEMLSDKLNVIMIAQDAETKEVTHLCTVANEINGNISLSHKINELIKMVNDVSIGQRQENGNIVANELFTIIANVVAIYCGSSESNYDSFKESVKYWKDQFGKNKNS